MTLSLIPRSRHDFSESETIALIGKVSTRYRKVSEIKYKQGTIQKGKLVIGNTKNELPIVQVRVSKIKCKFFDTRTHQQRTVRLVQEMKMSLGVSESREQEETNNELCKDDEARTCGCDVR